MVVKESGVKGCGELVVVNWGKRLGVKGVGVHRVGVKIVW